MNEILQAGINKESFELNYNGGTIWCEHLDKTDITESIIETIITNLMESGKAFRKIAFVGIEKRWHGKLTRLQEENETVEKNNGGQGYENHERCL